MRRPKKGKRNRAPLPLPTKDLLRRLFSKIELSDGCWVWAGAKRGGGYSMFTIGRTHYYVHRLFFYWFKTEIPDELVIDHLCNNTSCVNPNHLEATDMKQNIGRAKRRAYCKRGHPQIPENRYTAPGSGKSRCKLCRPSARRIAKT